MERLLHPRLRSAFVFAATALAAYLVAGCTTGSGDFYAATEASEPGRTGLENQGQRNCMVEALAQQETSDCPGVATGAPHPARGILVLDDFYIQPGGPASPSSLSEGALVEGYRCWSNQPTSCSGPTNNLISGMNTARASRGLLPDIILPGAGRFMAAYGWFNNTNGDESVRVDDTGRTPSGAVTAGPANEFVRKPDGNLVSYVEPGSRPSWDNLMRPGDIEPDITYVMQDFATMRTAYLYEQKSAGTYAGQPAAATIWFDGSLLRTLTVTTVTDPLFTPAPNGRPYTTTASSLVDIDVYGALAPGPVSALFASVAGPAMDRYASPSWGLCPNACVPGPVPLGGTPASGPGGLAQGLVWAPNLPETRLGSGNSAEGRLQDFQEGYRGWVDVIPAMRATYAGWFIPVAWTPTLPVPLSRSGAGEPEPTLPPGTFFAPEAWVGVWNDRSQDGRIGLVDASDPYEGGSRPNPDNYYDSRGEFFGVEPKLPEGRAYVTLTFTPDTDWGPGGVYHYYSSMPNDPFAESPSDCMVNGAVFCFGVTSGSTKSFELVLTGVSPSGGGGWFVSTMPNPKGHYSPLTSVVFPAGSPGFTVCTDVLVTEWAEGGSLVRDAVRDCDHYAPWLPA
ncbi:MAG TPA: hypothetical protein VM889_04505 [Candidatus Thermoplasmatota archaeon]|nr:hypothetical protein [Candidatus Thermoplasmatota archaeon]